MGEPFVLLIPVQGGGDEPKGLTPRAFIHSYLEKIGKSVVELVIVQIGKMGDNDRDCSFMGLSRENPF